MLKLLSLIGSTAVISGSILQTPFLSDTENSTTSVVHDDTNLVSENDSYAKTNITVFKPVDITANLNMVAPDSKSIGEEILLTLMIENPEIPELIDVYLSYSSNPDIWEFKNIELTKPKPGLIAEFENATIIAKSNNPDFIGAMRMGVKLTNKENQNLIPITNHVTKRNLGMLKDNKQSTIITALKEKNPNVILEEINVTQITSTDAIIIPKDESSIYDPTISVVVNFTVPNSPSISVDMNKQLKIVTTNYADDYFVIEKNIGVTTSSVKSVAWTNGDADSKVDFGIYNASNTIYDKNREYSVSQQKVTGISAAKKVATDMRINKKGGGGGIVPTYLLVNTYSGISQYKNERGETILQFVNVMIGQSSNIKDATFTQRWSGDATFSIKY
ncbi:hypothetical protein STIUS_v1c04640 [Spiroplasma sp. TIUS-1]|uniref:hypothetical protein n=1 Tax=Spiroplasma sp. TIUS-1 TaxID=216963 RepID=UPI0013993DA2|nr:hypothetical protein [Spiroplasma sp. TIUS-1]QHX36018.1 hypothetical protein STIUS_v1c04640 [Spiroplasma sp. TIUS-1]